MSVRDCTKQFYGVKAGWPVAWAHRLRRLRGRAPETHACPTPARQNDEITLRKAVSVRKTARRKDSLGASVNTSSSTSTHTGNASGANQSDEVGNSDAARRFGIPEGPCAFVRAMRSSLAASVRSFRSPTRPV